MIRQKDIINISLLVSIVGILLLVVVVDSIQPQEIQIENITDDMVYERVVINGVIQNLRINDGHIFFEIDDGSQIKVVIFESQLHDLEISYDDFENGKNILIDGVIEVYKGELEILPKNVAL